MAQFEAIYCILMSEEESRQNQEQVVKNKEEAERKFGCPCGKWYLSYPALYTHIKTKHDGRQPESTLKTGLATPHSKRTRGKL